MTKLTSLHASDAAKRFPEAAWREAVDRRDTYEGCAAWQMEQAEAYLEGELLEDDDVECPQATREGWCIIDKNDTGELEIQKDDDTNVFHSDEDALAHVQRRATEGSLYHHHALFICKRSRDDTPMTYEVEVSEELHHSFEMGNFVASSPHEAAQDAHNAWLHLEGDAYREKETINSNDRTVTVKRVSDGKEFTFAAGDYVDEREKGDND